MGKRKAGIMEQVRKPLQGVRNIVRFNWHLYAMSGIGMGGLTLLYPISGAHFQQYVLLLICLIVAASLGSLLVSCYIYDFSELYKLSWLDFVNTTAANEIVNIHAGFDETSELLLRKFDNAKITVLDFYDPQKHTEVSIKRARQAYPPFPGTLKVTTAQLQLEKRSADLVFLILSAHEIRNTAERISFFEEVAAALKPEGRIIVTEHLRGAANFLVYNIGAFHFHSKRAWLTTFRSSALEIERTIRVTPFITTFVLKKYGATS